MKTTTTLIVGGNGKTGRRVAERLKSLGVPVRIASRSGDTRFDWENDATWAPAVRGAAAAYVTYHPDLAFPGAAERVGAFAKVAVDNGVRRLVLLSGRNEDGARRGEELVRMSGAEWAIVRSSFFNQNFSESIWADAVRGGELAVPAGRVTEPFIDSEDLADVAVAALTDDRHIGRVYEVTGPRLLTFGDVAEEISRASGREIRYVPVSIDEFVESLTSAGVPADFVAGLKGLFTDVLDGRGSYLTDGVRLALGREPRDFTDFARDAAARGVWGGADPA